MLLLPLCSCALLWFVWLVFVATLVADDVFPCVAVPPLATFVAP